MKTIEYNFLSSGEKSGLLKRPAVNSDQVFEIVKPIIEDVKNNGIEAVKKYSLMYEQFTDHDLKVSSKEFDDAERELDKKTKTALKRAAENIKKFHELQLPLDYNVETMPGVKCSREFRAIEDVGLYIPGGTAVLPSTMLMLAVPAQIAGCKRIVVCSPSKENKINAPLLYAAKICGITEFYKTGGAHAVALMGYGAGDIKKVNKIFGPGNQYVTAAKMLVSIDPSGCAVDMPAGPSEVLIIADETAAPEFIAADLLSQAEHGSDSQVIFITTSNKLAAEVNDQIAKQIELLPRKKFARQALENSFTLIVDSIEEALEFSNQYAPEHLIINFENAEKYKDKVINAGSVFIGQYSPESAGDYASGTNHSLPTYGFAKAYSGVTVEMFMKSISFQTLTKDGLKNLSETIISLANIENLEAHKNAVTVRLK